MERHASWFPLVAIVLVVVGLLTLATPPPAQAFDPQLALALASAAGAIALIVGYLIVANNREKNRASALEGVYTCGGSEDAGPMGCAASGRSLPMVAAPPPLESPMAADARGGSPGSAYPISPMTGDTPIASSDSSFGAAGPMAAESPAGRTASSQEPMSVCPGGLGAGPMGCGGPTGSAPVYSAAPSSYPSAPVTAAPASAPVALQGQ